MRYSGTVYDRKSLPLLWLLSDARNDDRLEETLSALPQRSGFVFRHYHLDPVKRRARFDALAKCARDNGHIVILSGRKDWGADGTYGPSDRLGNGLRLATAHDESEIQAAIEAQADGIFLSPVFQTASHPAATPLGAQGFRVLARQSPVPVIALGGMTQDRARELEWPRWGAIDGLDSTNSA